MELMRFLLRSSPALLLAVVSASVISGGLGGALIALVNRALALHGVRTWTLILAFVAVIAGRLIAQFIAGVLLMRVAQETLHALTRRLCNQVLRTAYDRVEAMGAPTILATLTDDVGVLTAAMLALPTLVTSLAMLVGCSIYIACLSWTVFAACAGVVLAGLLGNHILLRRAESINVEAREARERLLGAFKTLTEGLKELKLHRARRAAFLQQEIEGTTVDLRRLGHVVTSRYLLVDSWDELLFYGLIAALLFLAPSLARLTPTELTGYVFAALYMMNPTWSALSTLPVFGRGKVALAKIREMGAALDESRAEPESAAGAAAPLKRIQIEFDEVCYTYRNDRDEQPFSVGPIDLGFTSGEIVFIAGGNGSGKSTLVKLLTGLYAPESGEIRINGLRVNDGNRDAYRQHFAAVFSDYHLFAELFGLETNQRTQQVLEYLQLLRLDRKLQVENGRFSSTALSSGQRKRLALLTALLEDRPVYVFDEWAADQDPAYKDVFYMKVLPRLRAAGRCVVVVTHDDRYFHAGDRVIKLEAGQPVSDRPERAAPVGRLADPVA
jgi:putative ATP-binding cassette transporter